MRGTATLSDVMHEINTPLSVAASHAQLALRRVVPGDDPELEHRLRRIVRSTREASWALRELYEQLSAEDGEGAADRSDQAATTPGRDDAPVWGCGTWTVGLSAGLASEGRLDSVVAMPSSTGAAQ